MNYTLRTYQQRVLESLYAWWVAHPGVDEAPICVMPTGSGKSLVIAELARLLFDTWPEEHPRTVVLVPSKELAQQNAEKLAAILPSHIRIGYYSASLGRKVPDADVIVATIGSIYRDAHLLGVVRCVVIDEAHFVNPGGTDAGRYRKFLADLARLCAFRVVGLTATPFRGDGVWLTSGDAPLFTGIAATIPVQELLDSGHLSPLVRPMDAVQTRIDTAEIKTTGGDYNIGELSERVDAYLPAAAAEAVRLAADRRKWIAFCTTVANAEHLVRLLQGHGISTALVCGETPPAERASLIGDFRAGRLRCLVTVLALATGFDVPDVDCILWLRPTQSPVLYVQGAGRGLRIADGKVNCLAEGQRVLTDIGLVPIEKITTAMRVWDGFSFVAHDGAICKGEQEVISYAGLTATPEHRVWTENGWKSLSECAINQVPIYVGGNGRRPVREADRHFRFSDGHQWQQVGHGAMRRLWNFSTSTRQQFAQGNRWMSLVQQPNCRAGVACQEVRSSASALHESVEQAVAWVRWPWDQIRLLFSDSNGCLHSVGIGAEPCLASGPDRQRSRIRTGEFEAIDTKSKSGPHQKNASELNGACVQDRTPKREVRGLNTKQDAQSQDVTGRSASAMGSAVMQTKRQVWDILNAGPLHRFTCEGLIVSNCLWLDFSDTTARLGPIDEIKGRKKRGKVEDTQAPCIVCDNCGARVRPASTVICPECGHTMREPEEDQARAASNAAVMAHQMAPKINTYPVTNVTYGLHHKEGSRDSLKVEYWSGLRQVAREWVCIEHSGFAGEKARRWCVQRAPYHPPPSLISDALGMVDVFNEPCAVRVNETGKYPEIIGYEWASAEAVA